MVDDALVIQGGIYVIQFLAAILVLFIATATIMNWTERRQS